ncbi:MAG: PatB family C-S lyase [Pseudomonadota bacterium]|nr:PatB family C-S lyase [Pseudomonadota bacterium]
MVTDFDLVIDRAGSASVKLDACKAVFATEDVIPLWVADMDFAAPKAVSDALTQRAQHPIYGYSLYPETMFTAMQAWFLRRHDWAIKRETIVMCPGVVPSMHAAIMALSEIGDKVIVQPPVYPPFYSAVKETGREILLNTLKLSEGQYSIDFEHLEQCAASGAKLLLLCSPHNPVGRVWQRDELERVLDIARRYQLTIISDEIHADLIYPDYRHIPLATLADDVVIVTAISPSKSFNIAGLGLSCLVVNELHHRKAINGVFESLHISACNPFSITAFEAAYLGGEKWLDELMVYIDGTHRQVIDYFETNSLNIKVIGSQGTYLLWLDCRSMALNDEELKLFFINKAKVGMNTGISFGEGGSGFMRMNIASPRAVIIQALENIKKALR